MKGVNNLQITSATEIVYDMFKLTIIDIKLDILYTNYVQTFLKYYVILLPRQCF